MKQLLSNEILETKQSKLSKAEIKNDTKTKRLESSRESDQKSLDLQIIKAKEVYEKRCILLENKLSKKIAIYDQMAADAKEKNKELAELKIEKLKKNIIDYFAKRRSDLDIDFGILNENFDWAVKDLNSGIDKTKSYNTKVLLTSVRKKYDKLNYKLNWQEIKEEIISTTPDKAEQKVALKNAKIELYKSSDGTYKPAGLLFKDYFEMKKLAFQTSLLNERMKWARCGQWSFSEWINARIWTIPVWMYTVFLTLIGLGIGFDSMYAGSHGGDHLISGEMMYPIAILLVVAIIGGVIFSKIPIWNKYFGGAVMGSLFVGAFLVYFGAIPKDGHVYEIIDGWFSDSNFLSMYISVLLVGAVILIPRKMIIKATGGFFIIIGVGVIASLGLGFLGALMTGTSVKDLILKYALPILSDGNGGGIQPIAAIAEAAGYNRKKWMSAAMAISTLASILSVIAAGILNGIGNAKPSLSGDGQLLQRDIHTVERPVKIADRNIAAGILLILMVYISSDYIAKLLTEDVIGIKVPNFAWMIIICLLLNLCSLVPGEMKAGVQKVNTFISKQTTWLLMVGVGICNIDLVEFFKALNGTALLISVLFILGATVGPLLVARMLKFNAVEAAVSAGLCMTAQGGSGAIACLGASNRMELMPYSQITCRIAGSVVLIFAALAFSAFPPTASEMAPNLISL